MIICRNLSLHFDGKHVLNELDLEISDGERLVVLGVSGSGKSSLLRLIAGLIAPTSGEILIDNALASESGKVLIPPHKRGVSMVFQDLALWPHMNVAENIAFALKMHKVPKKERIRKVEEMLKLVGLEGYGKRHIDQLSGGEQQRVALARALVLSPKTVLMDEPLSSLDRTLNRHLRKEIVRLQKLFGFTLLYVTHSEEEAAEIGTRIISIENGSVNQVS